MCCRCGCGYSCGCFICGVGVEMRVAQYIGGAAVVYMCSGKCTAESQQHTRIHTHTHTYTHSGSSLVELFS